jgi:hypothetical protein
MEDHGLYPKLIFSKFHKEACSFLDFTLDVKIRKMDVMLFYARINMEEGSVYKALVHHVNVIIDVLRMYLFDNKCSDSVCYFVLSG